MSDIQYFKVPRYGLVLRNSWPDDATAYVTILLAVALQRAAGGKLNAMPFVDFWLEMYAWLNRDNWNERLLEPSIVSSILAKDPEKFQANMCAMNYVRVLGRKGQSYLIETIDYYNPPSNISEISYLTHPWLVSEETAGYKDKNIIVNIQGNIYGYNYLIAPESAFLPIEQVLLFPDLPYYTRTNTGVNLRSEPRVADETDIGDVPAWTYVTISEYHLSGHGVWGYIAEREGWIALRYQPTPGSDVVREYVSFLSKGDSSLLHGPVRFPGKITEPSPPPQEQLYCQQVINKFQDQVGGKYWEAIQVFELEWLAKDRGAPYTGPMQFDLHIDLEE